MQHVEGLNLPAGKVLFKSNFMLPRIEVPFIFGRYFYE